MTNKGFVFGALAVVAVLVAVFFGRKGEEPPLPSQPRSQAPAAQGADQTDASELFVRPHSPRFGNGMARVTVVEWLDPECETCRAMHPAVKRLVAEYGDRVLFVIRYMPYHGGSMFAASALEEARERGKFEEALDVLFEKQPEWGDHHQPRPDLIPTYLTPLGIPAASLEKDAVIAKHGEKVRQDEADGNKVGVQGTPSFFVNQKPLRQLGEQPLRDMIEAELAGARTD